MVSAQPFRDTWHLPDEARVAVPNGFCTSAEEALLWYDGPVVVIAHAGERRWLAVNSDARCEIVDGEPRWTMRWVCVEITNDEAATLRAAPGEYWRDRRRSLWTRRPVLVVDEDNSGAGHGPTAWSIPARHIKEHLPILADPKRPGQWSDRTRRRRARRLERARRRRMDAHNRWCNGMWKIHVSGRRVWRERKFNPPDLWREVGRF